MPMVTSSQALKYFYVAILIAPNAVVLTSGIYTCDLPIFLRSSQILCLLFSSPCCGGAIVSSG